MSRWHRNNPDLIGSPSDPNYGQPGYNPLAPPVSDSQIAEYEEKMNSRVCVCGHRYDEHDADPPGGGSCEVRYVR